MRPLNTATACTGSMPSDGELDSVTNYPFRNALVSFLTGKTDAHALKDFFIAQAVNYPRPFYYALMNLLSSHDIERIRTALSVRIDPHELTREQQAGFAVSDSQRQEGGFAAKAGGPPSRCPCPACPASTMATRWACRGFWTRSTARPSRKARMISPNITPSSAASVTGRTR